MLVPLVPLVVLYASSSRGRVPKREASLSSRVAAQGAAAPKGPWARCGVQEEAPAGPGEGGSKRGRRGACQPSRWWVGVDFWRSSGSQRVLKSRIDLHVLYASGPEKRRTTMWTRLRR